MKICFPFSCSSIQLVAQTPMQFLSPLPNSTMQNPNRDIVIRPGKTLDPSSLSEKNFTITGSQSGKHDFAMRMALDKKTINLNPVKPFAEG